MVLLLELYHGGMDVGVIALPQGLKRGGVESYCTLSRLWGCTRAKRGVVIETGPNGLTPWVQDVVGPAWEWFLDGVP